MLSRLRLARRPETVAAPAAPIPGTSAAIISDLEARLYAARQALERLRANKKTHALRAVNGDETAAETIGRIELQIASKLRIIELLELAIEDVRERAADIDAALRACHEQYRSRLPAMRLAEKERRARLQPEIDRFRKTGEKAQAVIWQRHLDDPALSLIEAPPPGYVDLSGAQ